FDTLDHGSDLRRQTLQLVHRRATQLHLQRCLRTTNTTVLEDGNLHTVHRRNGTAHLLHHLALREVTLLRRNELHVHLAVGHRARGASTNGRVRVVDTVHRANDVFHLHDFL